MDEALQLLEYLPFSFKTQSEQEYIKFLWEAFESNYTNEKYQFAFLAYHMITMCFIYFNIWQIKQNLKDDFEKAIIGFSSRDLDGLVHKDDTDNLKKWTVSPFNFSKVQERSIIRILALIGCDKSKIGNYGKLIDDRNNTAHPNGNIYYSNQQSLDKKISEIIKSVDEIQTHSKSTIEKCYQNFLLESYDAEEREYIEASDQIREVLIHQNYLSQKDIEICRLFDLNNLNHHPDIDNIRLLHETLKSEYQFSIIDL